MTFIGAGCVGTICTGGGAGSAVGGGTAVGAGRGVLVAEGTGRAVADGNGEGREVGVRVARCGR